MELSRATLESDLLLWLVELTTSLGVALFALLGGTWLVWRATRSVAWRCSAVALLALCAWAAASYVPYPTEQGTWVCRSCGESREELRYLDYTLFASPLKNSSCNPRGGIAREDGEHEWSPTGCHFHGRDIHGATMVGCSFGFYP